jgi:WD40 repeat protein
LDKRRCRELIPGLGGFVYSLSLSPVQASSLAIGSGGQAIHIWDVPRHAANTGRAPSTNERIAAAAAQQRTSGQTKILWGGLQAKVSSVQWHPQQAVTLAFGADDGRVGIYDTQTGKHQLFPRAHRGLVHSLAWHQIEQPVQIEHSEQARTDDAMQVELQETQTTTPTTPTPTTTTTAAATTSKQSTNNRKRLPVSMLYSCAKDGIILVGDAQQVQEAQLEYRHIDICHAAQVTFIKDQEHVWLVDW